MCHPNKRKWPKWANPIWTRLAFPMCFGLAGWPRQGLALFFWYITGPCFYWYIDFNRPIWQVIQRAIRINCHLLIQLNAHSAFLATQGRFSIALNSLYFSLESLINVSNSKLYISDKNKTSNQAKCRYHAKEEKRTSTTKLYQNEYFPLLSETHRMPEPANNYSLWLKAKQQVNKWIKTKKEKKTYHNSWNKQLKDNPHPKKKVS